MLEKFKISQKSIFVCGTPRYETFFKKKDSKLKKIYNKNYILFLGTSLKFDEEIIVEKIDGILQKIKSILVIVI